mgnify:CR=1 FL=1
MLDFSLDGSEHIRIKCDEVSQDIKYFFDYEFNKQFDSDEMIIDVPHFLRNINNINRFLAKNKIPIHTSNEFVNLVNNVPSYIEASLSNKIEEDVILTKIQKEGFKRVPTNDQMRNLQKLCSIRAGASFSVPGAGKTTEALAFHAYHKTKHEDKLLVISPINAFTSWNEELQECYETKISFSRLRGTTQEISAKISAGSQYMIINYEALYTHHSKDKFQLIKNLILKNKNITVILDESHKSKGENISEIIAQLSPYINKKLILTGTPMPQAPSDLRPQFNFLYPHEHIINDDELVEKFNPVYVRTTKENLGLMKPIYNIHKISPYPAFKIFYDEYFAKRLAEGATLEEILSVKSFKEAVLKLLKLLSNPASCFDDIFDLDPSLANHIQDEGDGAKIDAVIKRANALINQGEKVIIWSSFVINVELIAQKFGNKAVYIHGGVPSKSEEDSFAEFDSREEKIRRFKTDSECMVLVANPAAAAESISLHKQCNYALYLDRTYNAGQFLQSQDRIHRLISKELEQQKYIEVFLLDLPECGDWKVHAALNRKIENMAAFLNDSSLLSLHGFDYDLDSYQDKGRHVIDEIDRKEFYQ